MKIKKIFIFSFLALFLSPLMANAETKCAWRAETTNTNPELSSSQTTQGCYSDEHQARAGEICSGTKPTTTSFAFTNTRYVCCCTGDYFNASTQEAPKFVIPTLQVDINGLQEKLSQPQCEIDESGNYQCKVFWLSEYIINIYDYGVKIAGILAALVLMAGGILWLVSGGDASKVTQAKELIIGSVSGLVILLASYIILAQINPDLVNFQPITVGRLEKAEALSSAKASAAASKFISSGCATDEELKNGVDFYATGYYKPAWEDSDDFFCIVGMQCSCPQGRDESKTCPMYKKTFPDYKPCKKFDKNTPYCNKTASDSEPKDGDIAGPDCSNLPFGEKVCFKGKTYTITDRGGAIKGKRIDIWSGDSLDKALSSTGVGKLTIGSCSGTCNDCSEITKIPTKDSHRFANNSLLNKLNTAWNNSNGLEWQITEAYPKTIDHASLCHNDGTCVDVALYSANATCDNVKKLISILQKSGLSVLNEYPNCDGVETEKATGSHLHVK